MKNLKLIIIPLILLLGFMACSKDCIEKHFFKNELKYPIKIVCGDTQMLLPNETKYLFSSYSDSPSPYEYEDRISFISYHRTILIIFNDSVKMEYSPNYDINEDVLYSKNIWNRIYWRVLRQYDAYHYDVLYSITEEDYQKALKQQEK